MVFSKRERIVFILTAAAIAALVLDRYALTPLLAARESATILKTRLTSELQATDAMLHQRKILGRKWREMLAGGMKARREETESQAMHAVRNFSQESGLKLSSLLTPQNRSADKTVLSEVSVHAAGTGSMRAVSGFIRRLETAKFPLKILSLQITSRKEGTDDLQVKVEFSTLYDPDAEQTPTPPTNVTAAMGGQDK